MVAVSKRINKRPVLPVLINSNISLYLIQRTFIRLASTVLHANYDPSFLLQFLSYIINAGINNRFDKFLHAADNVMYF